MKVLVDTHIALWAITNNKQLTEKAKAILLDFVVFRASVRVLFLCVYGGCICIENARAHLAHYLTLPREGLLLYLYSFRKTVLISGSTKLRKNEKGVRKGG